MKFSTIPCRSLLTRICIALGLIGAASHAQAEDEILGEYVAVLSVRDHVSNTGEVLRTVADILTQDRINYHDGGRPDGLDESDPFFGSEANRALIPQLLRNYPLDRETAHEIISEPGTLIFVTICRADDGTEYLDVFTL